MELENLKTSWEELSRQLSRQQIITRTMLAEIVRQRRRSLTSYAWLNIALCAGGIPMLVGIASYRGLLHHPVMHIGMVLLVICLCGEILKLRPLLHMERMQDDIASQQREATRHTRLQMVVFIGGVALAWIYLLWTIIANAAALRAQGTWAIALAAVIAFTIAIPLIYRWERGRIGNLRKALAELKEFSEE